MDVSSIWSCRATTRIYPGGCWIITRCCTANSVKHRCNRSFMLATSLWRWSPRYPRKAIFSYEVIDIRTVDAGALLESLSLADNLLAILSRYEDARAVVRRILDRLMQLPEKARADALAKLLVLSGLRKLQPVVSEEVQQMPITIDIMENPFLR